MRKKFTMLLASLFLVMGTSVAQVYQKVPHTKWTVTALNQAGVQGNEGGIDFLKDEYPETFYHSDYSNSYSDGTSGKKKGQDGLQAFMVELPEVMPIDKITYKGRSNGGNNWATKARIYVFETLPDGWPKDGEAVKQLNAMTYTEKEGLLKRDGNTVLGTPAFDNNDNGTWAADQNIKTAEFSSTQQGKYILFVADATTANNGYLCCGDFHVWQKLEGIVEDKPYFLKINGLDSYYLDTRVGENSNYGNTICKTQTPVATYFTLNDGYWHVSSLPGNERNFVGITNWDAIPGQDTPANWTLHKVEVDAEHSLWSLAQSTYYGSGDATKHYLGANDGNISGNTKVYTDKTIGQAVKFELVELTEEQAAAEATRVAAEDLAYAKENATAWLNRTGAGYPAAGSESRTTLLNAINAADATKETVEAALAEYQAHETVVMPEVGKVYRLVSGYTAFTSKKALYSDNNELKWQNKNDAAMNQLWTVQSMSDGNIVLMNVNDALYPQKTNFATSVTMFSAKNECSISFCGKGQFQVFANKAQRMFANGHSNGNGASGNITNYNDGGKDSYSSWYFEEVSITKEILSKQIESLKAAYIGSLLVKQEGVVGLQTAVNAAQEVCNAEGDYATAFASLVNTLNTTTIDYIEQGYFRMKSKEGGKYAYNDNTSLKATTDKNSPKTIIKLTEANNGTFYIQNGNGCYAQGVSQSTIVNTAASPLEYVITRLASDHYVLRPKNSTTVRGFWHQDGSSNVVGWSSDAGNSQWIFEAVEDADKIYSVKDLSVPAADTYISYNGNYNGDKDVKQVGGFYVLDNAPTSEDFTVKNIGEGMTSKVVVEGNSISVNAGYNGSNIYTLRCKKGDSYARYHSGCQLSADDATNMLTYEGTTYFESLFFIEEGLGAYEGYYTIRSVAAPTMYAYNLKTADEDSKVAMQEAPAEGGLTSAYYWKISSFGKETPANITPWGEGGDAYGWNKRGSYDEKNHIGYWYGGNGTDDNKWYVRLVEEEFVPSLHSVVGHPTKESYEEYLSYAQFINQDGFNKLKNPNWDVVLPEVGKYYRIKNDNGTGYLSSGTGTGRTQFKADIADKESSIFYYDGKLASYENGFYLGESGGFIHYTESNSNASGIDITFKKSPVLGKLLIGFKQNTRSFYSNQAGGSNGASAGQTGEFYRFTVEEVDMSFVKEQFDELVSIARAYANWMDYGRYTHTDYTDASELGQKIEEIDLSVNANTTIAELKTKIQLLEDIIDKFNIRKVEAGFYYFVNYDNTTLGEYLSDDRKSDVETQRVLTTDISAKNIFYYDGQALMNYTSGFGFEYGICNTKTPEKMNYFTFGEAYELGKYTVISTDGTSTNGYADGYWKNNNGELERVSASNASGWDVISVDKLPVTIGSILHATFYAPVAVTIPEGVKAYTGMVKNEELLTLTEITGTIPAGTAVVLIAENADTYYFEIVASEEGAIASSHLEGTVPTIVNDKKTAEVKYYTLQTHDFNGDGTNDGVAFKKYTGDNLIGFRAYLELPEETKATALRISFSNAEDEDNQSGTTEIGNVESTDDSQQSVVYDLLGRRVLNDLIKGIYIVNGKKVVIK